MKLFKSRKIFEIMKSYENQLKLLQNFNDCFVIYEILMKSICGVQCVKSLKSYQKHLSL